jgi:hypothetical protein
MVVLRVGRIVVTLVSAHRGIRCTPPDVKGTFGRP